MNAALIVALLVVGCVLAGCATAPADPRAALPPGSAEISVTNLTPHPWLLTLRAPKVKDAIRVDIKPRETFALTLPGGEYAVEQTLMASETLAPVSRQFTAQFESGERYRWNLATLLATDEAIAP